MEPTTKFKETDLKRLYWHSRRGMLELDLLLIPFAQTQLKLLDDTRLAQYEALLAEEDQDLYTWLTKRLPPPSLDLQEILKLILAHNDRAGQRPAS